MWVPGCSVYFIVMLIELGHWFRTPGADKQALRARQQGQTLTHFEQEGHRG